MAVKQCPQCKSSIPAGAKKCKVCLSDVEQKTPKQRRVAAFVRAAGIFRDWVGVPLTVVTLLAAFFGAAQGTVLKLLNLDRAAMSAKLFDADIINIGLDDQLLSNQVDKVTKHEGVVRGQLINDGYSLASFRPNFRCTGPQQKDRRMVYTFKFYDLQKGGKVYPEVAPRSTLSFFALLTGASEYSETQFPAAGPKKCSFDYFDKYGRVDMKVDLSDQQISLLDTTIVRDEPAELRNRFCAGLVTELAVANKVTADCVSDTHIIAVEFSYSSTDAIGRAMSYARHFADLSKSQTQRTPGVILVCDPKISSCEKDRHQTIEGYRLLGLSATAWFCLKEHTALRNCKRVDFPERK